MPGQESGIKVYGEQRGCALADYDHDGRVDVVVTQNAGPTRLYHNTGAKPGLRIRLQGPPQNPFGIGATIRLISGAGMGPAREIHAGSGYWSQDAPTQVLGYGDKPSSVWVRWPGGMVSTNAVPDGGREVTLAYPRP